MRSGKSFQKKVLINASNLHVGGGVQVASSFYIELLSMNFSDLDITFLVSDEVFDNVAKFQSQNHQSLRCKIGNTYGIGAFLSQLNNEVVRYDLVFTVFGPNYLRARGYIDLVGFAQALILDSSAYRRLGFFDRFKMSMRFWLQEFVFRRSDAFLVELEHVKEGLYRKGIASRDSVHVAYNCVSSLFFDKSQWEGLNCSFSSRKVKIGYLGRDYNHKNLSLLPIVKHILFEEHGIDVEVVVTLSDSEWEKRDFHFRQSVFNAGNLSTFQCPSFYEAMDIIIFPSLVECFSATPLEAMVMEKPIFASDRQFVRDVCGDFAFYFNPYDPYDVGKKISQYIQSDFGQDHARLARAKEHAITFSNPRGRAEKYLEVIRGLLQKKVVKG